MTAHGRNDAVPNVHPYIWDRYIWDRSAAPDRRERQPPADAPTCSWSPDRPRPFAGSPWRIWQA